MFAYRTNISCEPHAGRVFETPGLENDKGIKAIMMYVWLITFVHISFSACLRFSGIRKAIHGLREARMENLRSTTNFKFANGVKIQSKRFVISVLQFQRISYCWQDWLYLSSPTALFQYPSPNHIPYPVWCNKHFVDVSINECFPSSFYIHAEVETHVAGYPKAEGLSNCPQRLNSWN